MPHSSACRKAAHTFRTAAFSFHCTMLSVSHALYADPVKPTMPCLCSVRFSLLPKQEQAAAWQAHGKPLHQFRPLDRVQLLSRHWKIWGPPFAEGKRALMQEVNGEGVIGDYPVLEAGTPSSVAACSCCRQHQQAVVCCPCQNQNGHACKQLEIWPAAQAGLH